MILLLFHFLVYGFLFTLVMKCLAWVGENIELCNDVKMTEFTLESPILIKIIGRDLKNKTSETVKKGM